MRLPEIYFVVGTVLSLAMDGIAMQRNMIYNDEDLLIVELAAYRMRAILQNPENSGFRKLIKDNLAELKNSDFPWIRLRDVAYTTGSFWQRVVWWHDNLWADEATWVTTGVTMVVHASGMPYRDALLPTTDPDDWVRCVTHLTNRVNEEEIGGYALYPFLLFIPVAMLARWTRRPVLYIPCNGLQRLLLWAWVYCADWRAHRRLSTLQNIQERRKAALTMKHVFEHDFAEEIACCRMWGVIIGPNNSVF